MPYQERKEFEASAASNLLMAGLFTYGVATSPKVMFSPGPLIPSYVTVRDSGSPKYDLPTESIIQLPTEGGAIKVAEPGKGLPLGDTGYSPKNRSGKTWRGGTGRKYCGSNTSPRRIPPIPGTAEAASIARSAAQPVPGTAKNGLAGDAGETCIAGSTGEARNGAGSAEAGVCHPGNSCAAPCTGAWGVERA